MLNTYSGFFLLCFSAALDSLTQDIEKPKSVRLFTNTWSKQAEAIKESHFSSFFQDLLLYFPGISLIFFLFWVCLSCLRNFHFCLSRYSLICCSRNWAQNFDVLFSKVFSLSDILCDRLYLRRRSWRPSVSF